MPDVVDTPGWGATDLNVNEPKHYTHLFQVGKSINGIEPVGGNRVQLMHDANASIDSMVADMDDANDHVHLLFHIWLPDNNGGKIVGALNRASYIAGSKPVTREMAANWTWQHRLVNNATAMMGPVLG